MAKPTPKEEPKPAPKAVPEPPKALVEPEEDPSNKALVIPEDETPAEPRRTPRRAVPVAE